MLLSREYDVAPGTISQVLRNLEQEGLVRILPRKGVLLTDAAPAPILEVGAIGLRGSYLRMGIPGKESYRGFLVNEVLEAADRHKIPVLVLQHGPDDEPLTVEKCKAMSVRGLIYLGSDNEGEARALSLKGFPVISANRPLGRSPVNYVDWDHALLVRDFVQRFVDLGHRRIGVIIPPTIISGLLDAMKPYFIEALLSHGIQYDISAYWVSLDEQANPGTWSTQIDSLLDLPEPPTAIFCWGNDALNALHARVSARGIAIPKDLSIAAAPYNPLSNPEVSGFSYKGQDFGKKLLEGLIEKIRNPFHFVQEELSFQFIDHGSMSAPNESLINQRFPSP